MISPSRLAISIRGGATVVTAADLASMTTYVLLEQGDWFEPEIEFVRRFAQPGMTALDIGASHGVYALSFAQRLEGRGHVWALEPTSQPFQLLQAGVAANGFGGLITALQCGLSDRARHARMAVMDSSELNSLHLDHGRFEMVNLETIDHLVHGPLRDVVIDFVKLDAEGEELNVVRGGAGFLARQSPLVLFEIKHGLALNRGLAETFRALGYAIYRLIPGLNVLAPVDIRAGMETFQRNLFALKPDRAAQLAARGLLVPEPATGASEVPHLRWQSVLGKRPYSRLFAGAAQGCDAQHSGGHDYALDAFVSAFDERQDAARRLALLKIAADGWTRLHGCQPDELAYTLGLVRCFVALGERAAAMGLLLRAVRVGDTGGSAVTAMPFLTPLADQERCAPRASAASWMDAMLTEAIEVLHAHSSFFSRSTSANLHGILANPDLSRRMRKRYCLHAARMGGRFPLVEGAALPAEAGDDPQHGAWRGLLSAAGEHRQVALA